MRKPVDLIGQVYRSVSIGLVGNKGAGRQREFLVKDVYKPISIGLVGNNFYSYLDMNELINQFTNRFRSG